MLGPTVEKCLNLNLSQRTIRTSHLHTMRKALVDPVAY